MANKNKQLSEEKKALGVVVKENPFFPNGNSQDYDHEMFNSKEEEDAYCEAECQKYDDYYLEIGDSAQYPGGHI